MIKLKEIFCEPCSFFKEFQQRAAFQTTEVKELVSTLPLGTVTFVFSCFGTRRILKKFVYTPSGLRIRVTLLRIRIRLLTLMWIRILLIIKVMATCYHWSTDSILSRHASNERQWLQYEPLKLMKFDFNADQDPASHSNADPDPASHNADPVSQNNADLNPQPCPLIIFSSEW
jgi:hypothetical protein